MLDVRSCTSIDAPDVRSCTSIDAQTYVAVHRRSTKLQKRVEQYSTEASVYQEGNDRINIEIPGVTDANKILDELGKPGSLSFQTADGETVLTGTDVKSASAKTGQDDMGNKEYSVELNLTKSGTSKLQRQRKKIIGKQDCDHL